MLLLKSSSTPDQPWTSISWRRRRRGRRKQKWNSLILGLAFHGKTSQEERKYPPLKSLPFLLWPHPPVKVNWTRREGTLTCWVSSPPFFSLFFFFFFSSSTRQRPERARVVWRTWSSLARSRMRPLSTILRRGLTMTWSTWGSPFCSYSVHHWRADHNSFSFSNSFFFFLFFFLD